jgi:hypothetical protein
MLLLFEKLMAIACSCCKSFFDGGSEFAQRKGSNSPTVPFSLTNHPQMTLSDLIKSMRGGTSAMGIPNIKMGDLYASLGLHVQW